MYKFIFVHRSSLISYLQKLSSLNNPPGSHYFLTTLFIYFFMNSPVFARHSWFHESPSGTTYWARDYLSCVTTVRTAAYESCCAQRPLLSWWADFSWASALSWQVGRGCPSRRRCACDYPACGLWASAFSVSLWAVGDYPFGRRCASLCVKNNKLLLMDLRFFKPS